MMHPPQDPGFPRPLEEAFSDLVDGRLSAEQEAALRLRLDRDPALRREFERFQRLLAVLRGGRFVAAERAPAEPDPDLTGQILAALSDERGSGKPRGGGRSLLPYLASLLSAAAAVLLFLLLLPHERRHARTADIPVGKVARIEELDKSQEASDGENTKAPVAGGVAQAAPELRGEEKDRALKVQPPAGERPGAPPPTAPEGKKAEEPVDKSRVVSGQTDGERFYRDGADPDSTLAKRGRDVAGLAGGGGGGKPDLGRRDGDDPAAAQKPGALAEARPGEGGAPPPTESPEALLRRLQLGGQPGVLSTDGFAGKAPAPSAAPAPVGLSCLRVTVDAPQVEQALTLAFQPLETSMLFGLAPAGPPADTAAAATRLGLAPGSAAYLLRVRGATTQVRQSLSQLQTLVPGIGSDLVTLDAALGRVVTDPTAAWRADWKGRYRGMGFDFVSPASQPVALLDETQDAGTAGGAEGLSVREKDREALAQASRADDDRAAEAKAAAQAQGKSKSGDGAPGEERNKAGAESRRKGAGETARSATSKGTGEPRSSRGAGRAAATGGPGAGTAGPSSPGPSKAPAPAPGAPGTGGPTAGLPESRARFAAAQPKDMGAPATGSGTAGAPGPSGPMTGGPSTPPATNTPATTAPATNTPATNTPATTAPATDQPIDVYLLLVYPPAAASRSGR